MLGYKSFALIEPHDLVDSQVQSKIYWCMKARLKDSDKNLLYSGTQTQEAHKKGDNSVIAPVFSNIFSFINSFLSQWAMLKCTLIQKNFLGFWNFTFAYFWRQLFKAPNDEWISWTFWINHKKPSMNTIENAALLYLVHLHLSGITWDTDNISYTTLYDTNDIQHWRRLYYTFLVNLWLFFVFSLLSCVFVQSCVIFIVN